MIERFMKKVMPEPNSGCWLWTGSVNQDGYGRLHIPNSKRLKISAHRFSFEYFKHKIPSGLFVCHKCDNPTCVNPEHLFCGTPAENSLDCKTKGRSRKGERVNTAKLTPEIVVDIKRQLSLGEKQKDIAKLFEVTQTQISYIKTRKTWSHIE